MKRKTAEWFKRLPIWLKIAIPAGLLVAVGVLLWVVLFSKPNSLSEKDLEDIDTVCLRMEELRDSEEYINSDEEAKAKMALAAINALAEEGLVDGESVFYDEESEVISYLLSSGVLACEEIGEHENDVLKSSGKSKKPLQVAKTKESIAENDAFFADAIILDAVTTWRDVVETCERLADKWTAQGLMTEHNTAVTLDDMASLENFEFVYVLMHGGYTRYRQNVLLGYKIIGTTFIALEQGHNCTTDKKYERDLLKQRIVIGNGKYYIASSFFDAHYARRDLSGNIIFFGSCQLMGTEQFNSEAWTKVLQKKSIAAFVGSRNSINVSYNLNIVSAFMDEMLGGQGVQTALDSAKASYGKNDNEWLNAHGGATKGRQAGYPVLRGNPQAKLKGIENRHESVETTNLPQGEIVEKTEYATIYRITHTTYNGEQLVVDMYYDLAVLNGSDAITKKMNQQLYAAYEEWVDSFSFYEECWKDAINLPVYDKHEAHVQYDDSSIISILHHTVSGIGGNSIITGTYGHTFNLQTGEELQLKDLFPADEATLSKLILQRWNKYVGQEREEASLDEWEFYVGNNGEVTVWRMLYTFGSPDVPTGIYVGQPLPTPESEPEKVVLSEEDRDQIWNALCFWEYDMDGGTTIYNIFGLDYDNGIPVETGTIYPIKGNPSTEQIYAEVKKDARQYLIESKVEEAVRLTEQYVRTVNGIVYYQGQNNRGDAEISKDSLQYSYGDGNYYVSYNYWSKKDTPDETAIFVRENGVLHFAGRK